MAVCITGLLAPLAATSPAQTGKPLPRPDVSRPAATRQQRLILKDGSYQVVVRYERAGDRVRYVSAERGGEWEELPAELVDWAATEKWAREHAPGEALKTDSNNPALADAAAIDAEAAAARRNQDSMTPEVAPGLRLPDTDSVYAMDTFHGQPELLEIDQNAGTLNEARAHNVLKAAIAPLAMKNRKPIELPGRAAKVQLHVESPVLYVSLEGGEPPEASAHDFRVDTGGLSSAAGKTRGSPKSSYAIVKVQRNRDVRMVGAIEIGMLGRVSQSEQIVETTSEILPGGHWMRLTPRQPLPIGEYALVELLSDHELNLDVWDFGVDPRAMHSKYAIPAEGAPREADPADQ